MTKNQINIAELLKDCPRGMELDCTMYEDVYFDYVDTLNIIHCYIQHKAHKTYLMFNQHGTPDSDIKSKCVIFPKGKTTWEGFVPSCEFKNGDVVASTNGLWIGITTGGEKGKFIPTYCVIRSGDEFKAYPDRKGEWAFNRLATEKEKQKLFDIIKANGYKWNAETKTLEKLPKFKVGDKIRHKTNNKDDIYEISAVYDDFYGLVDFTFMLDMKYQDQYELVPNKFDIATLKPFKEEIVEEEKGNISDGYHTFNELYEYRLLYNASMFNELAKQGLYDVHKSKLHSDCTIPFGDKNWFIVQAELPTGQISNHYEMKDWDLFQVPIKEKANPYDGHTPQDVAKRLREFLTPKSQYPKTYEECCKIVDYHLEGATIIGYEKPLLENLQQLLICRDAYWKIAGEQMGLGKPWVYDMSKDEFSYAISYQYGSIQKCEVRYRNHFLVFPTKEMRDAFYANFKDLIESCKELL